MKTDYNLTFFTCPSFCEYQRIGRIFFEFIVKNDLKYKMQTLDINFHLMNQLNYVVYFLVYVN